MGACVCTTKLATHDGSQKIATARCRAPRNDKWVCPCESSDGEAIGHALRAPPRDENSRGRGGAAHARGAVGGVPPHPFLPLRERSRPPGMRSGDALTAIFIPTSVLGQRLVARPRFLRLSLRSMARNEGFVGHRAEGGPEAGYVAHTGGTFPCYLHSRLFLLTRKEERPSLASLLSGGREIAFSWECYVAAESRRVSSFRLKPPAAIRPQWRM
jgi:hypothetical protein